ncbi:sulfotransferase [Mumia zhuanghuii]|uniref:Sulfotransferase family protein n=2 Tax=Mumia TaxID=1546255 RepID=A0ABW1QIS0_9ACTN|nr:MULTISPECIES: sulfotransferase [Mumia]KAA1422644.1 sulfotransferase [Mumia zhuanghuii]
MGTFRTPRPDAFLVGAPKAGTSALHAALAVHPQVYSSRPKEPKYFMCADAPPPAYRGPGDAHSQREWIWRREDYEQLFADARGDQLRLESTPFYLYLRNARRRITEELPDARLVAVVRDPVDRAYSNWMHLWSDGLEPVSDFVDAFGREEERIAAGWAPFWHYRRLGMYGAQLDDLYRHADSDRILVLRYRELVEKPVDTLDRVCVFLGLEPGLVREIPRDNSRPYVAPGWRRDIGARVVRAGARAGALTHPSLWRRASRPLLSAMQWRSPAVRPKLDPAERAALIDHYREDIDLLEKVTGQSFDDWRNEESGGSFASRAGTA